MSKIRELVEHLEDARKVAEELGIYNLYSRGKIGEMIVADILGHTLLPGIDGPDAVTKKEGVLEYRSLTLPNIYFSVKLTPNSWKDQIQYCFFASFRSWLEPDKIFRVSRKMLLRNSSDGVVCKMKLSEMSKKGICFFDRSRIARTKKLCPGAERWL